MSGAKEVFVGLQALSEMAVVTITNLEQQVRGLAQGLKASNAEKDKLREQLRKATDRDAKRAGVEVAAREYKVACIESEGSECSATINARIMLFVALSLVDGDAEPAEPESADGVSTGA